MVETIVHDARAACGVGEPRAVPISVMHVVNPGRVGGLETVVRGLACGHALAGDDVHVVATADGPAARAFLSCFAGTRVRASILTNANAGYRRERAAAAALVRHVRPDVVHTHGYRPDVLDAGVARRQHIATVTTIHGFTGSSLRNRAYQWAQRRCLWRFDAVVAVSAPLAATLRPYVARHRLHLIHNGYVETAPRIDRQAARRQLDITGNKIIIGWIGRLSSEKGADVAITALASLLRVAHRMPFELVVIGDGKERPALQRLARQLGVESLVRWAGQRENAAALLGAFDLLLLSSHTEGTPMVLLEAIAARIPIVATAVGGVPDMLSPHDALLVPKDDPHAMALALLDVLLSPDAARARAFRAANALEERFSGDLWLRRYAMLYRQVRGVGRGDLGC